MEKSLSGKVALVTGGSRGIGAATARALADDGASVAISYSSAADKAEQVVAELTRKGVRAVAYKADLGDVKQIEKLVSDVKAKFGRLDILVNNAGVLAHGTVDSPETESLNSVWKVNTHGTIAAIRAASKVIADDGRIVSISTGLAARIGAPGLADYAGSKAALEAYSRGAARDLGKKRVTVNIVAAGAVNTDMNPQAGPMADWLNSTTILGRYAKPEEIANAVAFLTSPKAAYITGTVLSVDGGYAA